MRKSIFFLLALLPPLSAFSSVVQVITDQSLGQGFLYKSKSDCYVVTPSHVISDAKNIKILAANRKYYPANIEHRFDIDLALLKLSDEEKVCRAASFDQKINLSTLLKIYEEGVLKGRLSDGSTKQIKVDIPGVDETEYLQIKSSKEKDVLKQGYSGSVLYIANQIAGILLEVDEGSGYVYRVDALNIKLKSYFYVDGTPDNQISQHKIINNSFSGELSKGAVAEYKFQGEVNSPIEFFSLPSSQNVKFWFEILDRRNKVLYSKTYLSRDTNRFAFTPKERGTYTVRLTGSGGYGDFKFGLEQWALDSELRGEGNVIDSGDEFAGRLAKGAVAEYKFQGEANTPIEFFSLPSSQNVKFWFEILDRRNKVLYSKTYLSRDTNRFAFTPKERGTYTVRLTGSGGYGDFKFGLQEQGKLK